MKFELNDKTAAIHHDKGGLAAALLAFGLVGAAYGVSMI